MDRSQITAKYEADCDPGFAQQVASMPGGEQIRSCIQCGTCSGTCPLSEYMDRSPRATINLIRAGFKHEVLASNTHWLCSSCYACTVECPQQIHITDIMYAIKNIAIRERAYPPRLPGAVLAQQFTKIATSRGRMNEAWLVVQLNLRTNWINFLRMSRLGLQLVRTGRISLKPDQIKQRQQLSMLHRKTMQSKEGAAS
jgi:heterodisulfide reductase subunit C